MKDTAVACLSLTLEPVDLLLQLLDRPLGELGARLGLRNSGKISNEKEKGEENENEILAEVQQRSQMTDICGVNRMA